MQILVVHGPNLNLLGTREPEIYGATRLSEIDARLVHVGGELGVEVETVQSNHEGELVDRIQRSAHCDGFVANPGGLTHTSVVLRDAFLAMGKPLFEVHLSNPHAREEFRHESLIADIAEGRIAGFGAMGYEFALRGLVALLRDDD